jgi:secretion/DNA translocation related TadE-like protein
MSVRPPSLSSLPDRPVRRGIDGMPDLVHRWHVFKRHWWDADEGSGTMNGVMLVAVIGVLMSVVAVGGNLMITSARAQSAADQAAIAGAESAWREVLDPCVSSTKAAMLNSATVSSCTVDDQDVTVKVTVKTSVPIVSSISKQAKAGPEDCQ